MAALTVQTIAGAAITFGAVAAEDTVTADNGLVLHVKNAGGSADTVTLVDPGTTPAGSSATDPTYTCPATTGDIEIPLSSKLADSTGTITIQHSFTTSVTCAVKRFPF